MHTNGELLFLRNLLDSGHGGQTPDLDGDEVDGWDEGRPLFRRFHYSFPTSNVVTRDE